MILNFRLWLLLRENFDPAAYDDLFNRELDAVLPMVRNPEDRQRLASLRNGWTNYIAACFRNAGFREQGDLEEKIHDVVVKLLVSPGGLFRGYDESRHGPWICGSRGQSATPSRMWWRRKRTARSSLPPALLHADFVPARPEQGHDGMIIADFTNLLKTRLGDLAVAIFDARLEGRQMKDLVGLPDLDHPSRYIIKRTVQEIKTLAREYAKKLDDPDFLRRVEGLWMRSRQRLPRE